MIYSEPLRPSTTAARARKLGKFSFAFGPRFFVALLLGFVALGPAWWFRQAIAAMFLWDGVVLGAWLWDFLRLPRPEQLKFSALGRKDPVLECPAMWVWNFETGGKYPFVRASSTRRQPNCVVSLPNWSCA